MQTIKPGSTNQSVYFHLQDAVTGGAYTTAGGETSFNLSYTRDGAAQVSNDATGALANATADHADNKVFHCGNGVWRCDFPDAAFATGADHVHLLVTHDSGAFLPAVRTIDLWAAHALEAVLAVVAGNATFNESTGVASYKKEDGTTEKVSYTVTDVGTREDSTIS